MVGGPWGQGLATQALRGSHGDLGKDVALLLWPGGCEQFLSDSCVPCSTPWGHIAFCSSGAFLPVLYSLDLCDGIYLIFITTKMEYHLDDAG